MEASWPPKKPESYFRTLRRLLDLLVCWGGKGRGEKGGKVAEITCKMFKRQENRAFALETVSITVITFYIYRTIST